MGFGEVVSFNAALAPLSWRRSVALLRDLTRRALRRTQVTLNTALSAA
jgi:uncharacterized protein YjeT (DUF2065 family)